MVVLETNLRRTEGKCALQKKELWEKVQQRRSCKLKILKCLSKRKVIGQKLQNSKIFSYKNCKGECYTRTNRQRLLLRNFVYNTHMRKVHCILPKALLSESRTVHLSISLVLYTILPHIEVKAQNYHFKVSDHYLPLVY